MYVLPDSLVQELILGAELDTNLFPAGWVVRLFTTDMLPTRTSVIGDFTELTNVEVPGYAAVAGAWNGTPIRKPTGVWEDQGSAPLHYAASGPPPAPIVVYGWYATDAAKTTLIGSGRFEAPFTFGSTGDGFDLEQIFQAQQSTGTDYTLTLDMEVE